MSDSSILLSLALGHGPFHSKTNRPRLSVQPLQPSSPSVHRSRSMVMDTNYEIPYYILAGGERLESGRHARAHADNRRLLQGLLRSTALISDGNHQQTPRWAYFTLSQDTRPARRCIGTKGSWCYDFHRQEVKLGHTLAAWMRGKRRTLSMHVHPCR